jgi:hypothetical protein
VLHRTLRAAEAALWRCGAERDARLDATCHVAGLGEVRRLFGVLGASCAPELRAAIRLALESPKNAAPLAAGAHLPVNRAIAARLANVLPMLGAHVPWALDALHIALALRLSEADRAVPLPFRVFYVQAASWLPRSPLVHRGGVLPGAIVPLPVGGAAQGTWHEPASPLALDPECGLVVEANVLV